jgi:hypothetical protein
VYSQASCRTASGALWLCQPGARRPVPVGRGGLSSPLWPDNGRVQGSDLFYLLESRLRQSADSPINRNRGILPVSGAPGPSLAASVPPIFCNARRECVPMDGIIQKVGPKCSPAERLGERFLFRGGTNCAEMGKFVGSESRKRVYTGRGWWVGSYSSRPT